MSTIQEKVEQIINDKNVIPLHQNMVVLCKGNARDALLLTQIIYWCSRADPSNSGEVFESATDLREQLGLSDSMIKSAIKNLVKLGFIHTRNHIAYGHNTRWFGVNEDIFLEALAEIHASELAATEKLKEQKKLANDRCKEKREKKRQLILDTVAANSSYYSSQNSLTHNISFSHPEAKPSLLQKKFNSFSKEESSITSLNKEEIKNTSYHSVEETPFEEIKDTSYRSEENVKVEPGTSLNNNDSSAKEEVPEAKDCPKDDLQPQLVEDGILKNNLTNVNKESSLIENIIEEDKTDDTEISSIEQPKMQEIPQKENCDQEDFKITQDQSNAVESGEFSESNLLPDSPLQEEFLQTFFRKQFPTYEAKSKFQKFEEDDRLYHKDLVRIAHLIHGLNINTALNYLASLHKETQSA